MIKTIKNKTIIILLFSSTSLFTMEGERTIANREDIPTINTKDFDEITPDTHNIQLIIESKDKTIKYSFKGNSDTCAYSFIEYIEEKENKKSQKTKRWDVEKFTQYYDNNGHCNSRSNGYYNYTSTQRMIEVLKTQFSN